jgi:sulfonate transport system substrate-binding protein
MREQKKNNKTANNRRWQIVAGTLLLVVIAALILIYLGRHARRETASADLLHHPIYSTYTFETNNNIINFGYQPLWLFASNIAEIMKRDVTLKQRLEEIGMEIRFHAFLKGEDLNFFVLRNELQGGMCGDMPTLAIASTLSVVVPSLTDQGTNEVVAQTFTSILELKGKRIGYPHGSYAHHAVLDALRLYELGENEIRLIPMDLTEMVTAMKRKSIDACALWEPTTSLLLREVPNSAIIHRSLHLGFIYFREDFAESHLKAVFEILASEARAIRWMLMNRVHLVQSCEWVINQSGQLSDYFSTLSAEDLADIITRKSSNNFLPIIPSDALFDGGHFHREYELLRSLNKIPGSNPWGKVRDMFTNEYIRQILSNPVHYQLNDLRFKEPENG